MSEIVTAVESIEMRDPSSIVLPESAVIGCNAVQIDR